MGGDLSGRDGHGTEKYFPHEREAIEREAEEKSQIRKDAFNEAIKFLRKKVKEKIIALDKTLADEKERLADMRRVPLACRGIIVGLESDKGIYEWFLTIIKEAVHAN